MRMQFVYILIYGNGIQPPYDRSLKFLTQNMGLKRDSKSETSTRLYPAEIATILNLHSFALRNIRTYITLSAYSIFIFRLHNYIRAMGKSEMKRAQHKRKKGIPKGNRISSAGVKVAYSHNMRYS